jgi:drug/metabolite transporter (DMT)-like permease
MWFYFALAASILWGLNYALYEKLLQHISYHLLLGVNMSVGAIMMYKLAGRYGLKQDWMVLMQNKKLFVFIIMTITTYILANFCISYAIQLKNNAAAVASIESIYPIFTLIFTYVLFRNNHFTMNTLIGIFFIIIGLFFINRA